MCPYINETFVVTYLFNCEMILILTKLFVDGPDMQANMYNPAYYPMYYNGAAPWMYQQMPGMVDGQQMMPMYPGEEENLNSAFSQMNLGPPVPVLPWLP